MILKNIWVILNGNKMCYEIVGENENGERISLELMINDVEKNEKEIIGKYSEYFYAIPKLESLEGIKGKTKIEKIIKNNEQRKERKYMEFLCKVNSDRRLILNVKNEKEKEIFEFKV